MDRVSFRKFEITHTHIVSDDASVIYDRVSRDTAVTSSASVRLARSSREAGGHEPRAPGSSVILLFPPEEIVVPGGISSTGIPGLLCPRACSHARRVARIPLAV